MQEQYVPRIKPDDILSIKVSSLSKDANEMFNPLAQTTPYNAPTVGTIAPQPVIGFTVDPVGDITLPLVGKIHVAGLTSEELSQQLTDKLQHYLESPTVIVRIANYTVSVLGEVVRPALYTIPNEQITLPQVLAMAGDMTIYGKRNNVLIVREMNGERQFARVDMTKRDLFTSPFYYLHSGDVVYVEAASGKVTASDRVFQLTPVVVSSLTLLVLIINTFSK